MNGDRGTWRGSDIRRHRRPRNWGSILLWFYAIFWAAIVIVAIAWTAR